MQYTLKYVYFPENKGGEYTGYLMEIPGCVVQASSMTELKAEVKKSLEVMLDVLRQEEDEKPILTGWEFSKQIKLEL